MLELSNLVKSYSKGKVRAVDGLSLTVERGEIFGFIGPNGAGKTTTIKMIAGILRPDSGSVVINGMNLKEQPLAARRQVGYVPDSSTIYERLTGMEYLRFNADVYDVPQDKRKQALDKYLPMFSLEKAVYDQIRSYSHGMRQKLMVTAALLHNPPLWLLDEPLTGLDPKSAHFLKQEMRAHCNEGNTVFFSTHVLEVAEKLCDRIAIINHGKILAVGTLDELRNDPSLKQTGDSSLESIFLTLTEKEEAPEA